MIIAIIILLIKLTCKSAFQQRADFEVVSFYLGTNIKISHFNCRKNWTSSWAVLQGSSLLFTKTQGSGTGWVSVLTIHLFAWFNCLSGYAKYIAAVVWRVDNDKIYACRNENNKGGGKECKYNLWCSIRSNPNVFFPLYLDILRITHQV